MASCKDCVHYEVCQMHYKQKCELTYETEREVEIAMRKAQKAVDIECDYYKDRSRFVELPCKIGEKIYDPVRGQISEYKVISFGVNEYGLYLNLRCIQGLCRHDMIRPEWIGTTVFFTPEEAEQALKEVKNYAKKAKM